MTDILVFMIVALAAVYVVWKFKKSAKSGKCQGGCGGQCEGNKEHHTD